MSQLLRSICEEVNKNVEYFPKDVMKKISGAFLKGTEVSTQEAAWSLLGLSMSVTTESETFILIFPNHERTRLLKHKEELLKLDGKDTNVFEKNIIEKYANRDMEKRESSSLIEYAAYASGEKKNETNHVS